MTFETTAQELLNCMCVALGEVGWEGDCCVELGDHVWGLCCEGQGQAWARIINMYPTERFPAPGLPANPEKCNVEWGVVLELGALTCICADECSCEDAAADAARVLKYAGAALRGVLGCYADASCDVDARVTGLTMAGPEGTCAGFTIGVVVAAALCCPPT